MDETKEYAFEGKLIAWIGIILPLIGLVFGFSGRKVPGEWWEYAIWILIGMVVLGLYDHFVHERDSRSSC
jgi:hypothetical protein